MIVCKLCIELIHGDSRRQIYDARRYCHLLNYRWYYQWVWQDDQSHELCKRHCYVRYDDSTVPLFITGYCSLRMEMGKLKTTEIARGYDQCFLRRSVKDDSWTNPKHEGIGSIHTFMPSWALRLLFMIFGVTCTLQAISTNIVIFLVTNNLIHVVPSSFGLPSHNFYLTI